MDEDEKKMLFNEINILRELVSYLVYNTIAYTTHILWQITNDSYRIIQILLRCTNSSKMKRDITLLQSKLSKISNVSRICKGGELFDEIIARGKFTEKDAAVLMK